MPPGTSRDDSERCYASLARDLMIGCQSIFRHTGLHGDQIIIAQLRNRVLHEDIQRDGLDPQFLAPEPLADQFGRVVVLKARHRGAV